VTEQTLACRNCGHAVKHNLWGRCAEEGGCECRSYEPDGEAKVLVLRNPETMRPVSVPVEVVREVDALYDAYVRWRAGESFEQIARSDPTRWRNGSACSAEVKAYIDEGRSVLRGFTARETIAMEIDATRALQAAFWDEAVVNRKLGAAQLVRQLIKDRIDMYSVLPEDPDVPTLSAGGPRTLVIDAADYERQLRAISE